MKYFKDSKRDLIHLLEALNVIFEAKADVEIRQKFADKNLGRFTKWLFFSDYYFDDEKPNHVVTFTAIPYFMEIPDLKERIKAVKPTDFKKSRSHNPDFSRLMQTLPMFNFCVVLEKQCWFGHGSRAGFVEMFTKALETVDTVTLKNWSENQPEFADYHNSIRRRIRCLKGLLQTDKKIELIRRMFMVSTTMAYLGAYLNEIVPRIDAIGWFPDRDAINDICDEVIYDLFNFNYMGLTDSAGKNFVFSKATADADEWYKELTRLPDHITGAIADFDFNTRQTSKNKASDFIKDFAIPKDTPLLIARLRCAENKITPSVIEFRIGD